MRFSILAFLLSCIVLIIGCKDSSTTPPSSVSSIKELFPLQVGNEWKYKAISLDFNGLPKGDTIEDRFIRGKAIFQNQTMYERSINGDTSGARIAFYGDTGNYFEASYNSGVQTITRWLHYPMRIGETIRYFDSSDATFIQQFELTLQSNNEVVDVPAGIFSCYHYREVWLIGRFQVNLDTLQIRESYFSPGVGMIREEDYQGDQMILTRPKHFRSLQLISYTVK